jgi:release factor glutamine methyltransferase
MNLGNAFHYIRQALAARYDEREAAAIAHELMGAVTGLSKIDRLMGKEEALLPEQQWRMEEQLEELVQGRPLQYVLGTAYFMERPFKVNESVLIPRPETEELVMWIRYDHREATTSLSVLDIGTGSGCIPVSLKLDKPEWQLYACDISADALAVAKENAAQSGAEIAFIQADFLDTDNWPQLPACDILVSNPPYIPQSEAAEMEQHVTAFEPAGALFVPDQDPLLFYRNLAHFGKARLKEGGRIYCELHRDFAVQTQALFLSEGYLDVVLREDMHGNPRMLRAAKP